jgi:ATP-dependent DNA ligase
LEQQVKADRCRSCLACHNAVINDEAVVLDAKGRASCSALQADPRRQRQGALLCVFDCLFLDGRDLRKLPPAIGARRSND